MPDPELKVNDKRMFTADGELREEFRHLEESAEGRGQTAEAAPASTGESDPAATRETSPPEPSPPADVRQAPEPQAPMSEPGPAAAAAPGELSILDLVGLLAEHTALYLGEASLPDGQSVRDLRAAKMHVDLLDVLRRKTAGNLTAEETRVLEDILYRLRLIYVEKTRQEE